VISTEFCNRETRETWIRVKYVDRAFVAAPKLNGDSQGKKLIRKWSVRKPFRRNRNKSGGSSSGGKASLESSLGASAAAAAAATAALVEDKDTTSESESFKSFQSKGTGSSTSETEGVLVFGSDLPPSQTDIVGHLVDGEGEESAEEETDAREVGKTEI
jgi:hypothetical protein